MKGKIVCLFMMMLLILSALSVSGITISSKNNEDPIPTGFNENEYTITDLGTLGGISSYAGGMNELGDIIGRSSIPNGAQHAFLWVDGIMEDLGTPSGYLVSGATNVNDYGQVSGYTNGEYQSQYAYLWEDDVWTYLGTPPDLDYSVATDINNDGQITGYSFMLGPGGGSRGWIYEDGVMTDIGDLGGDDSNAFAINEQGQVVGVADTSEPGINHAFVWEDGVITDLGVLTGEDESAAYNINENGVVCGASSHTLNQYPFPTFVTACVWDDGDVTEIGKLPGYTRNNAASAINNQGQVVGYSSDNGNNPHAFIWEDGVLKDLNDLIPSGSGWELKGAADINNLGQIVGYGKYNGQTRAYLLTPTNNQNEPPEFSDEDPSNGQTNVPVSTSTLSVYISDSDGDSFDWSITTSPDVGSSSGTGEFDGTKNCDISGLNYETTYTWTVTATDTDGSGETTEEDYTFTTESAPNNPPNPPSNPDPSDGETNVDVNAILSWTCSDPDGDSLTYDVYFEANDPSPDVLVSNGQSQTYYNPPGQMEYNTHYYWKIVAWDPYDESTIGPVWDFTTSSEPNNPPDTPANPNPSNGQTNIKINADLSWTCSDPDDDDLFYDVYFEADDTTPDVLVSNDQIETTFDPGNLQSETTYYWQIIVKDEHGASTPGPIWHFITEDAPNQPPQTPTITGSTSGSPGTENFYRFITTDPEGDDVYFWIEWGDGDIEEWIGPYDSGEEEILGHTWNEKKTYTIRVKAKDTNNLESEWSELKVTMPRYRFVINNRFLDLFERFSNLFPVLRLLLQRLGLQ